MADEEYQEITLADLVGTIYRRKVVLVSVFLVAVLIGVAITAFATPSYQASATVIPLEHPDIIKNYLESRQAGEDVARDEGNNLLSRLFASRWDDNAGAWLGERPSTAEAGGALAGMISVSGSIDKESGRFLTITASSDDPALARDVANAFLASLGHLRPTFENITIEQKFEAYYDGQNEQAARARAEQVAKEKAYWLELDTATTPGAPSSPNVTLNIALSVVLGLMLGVFAVFIVEWASNYRAQRRAVEAPPPPEEKGAGFRMRDQ